MYARIFFSNISKNINVRSLNRNWLHTTPIYSAGHSKWQNIRHIKALKDGQRGDLFTKLARQIRLAIVEGGGSTDVKLNAQLNNIVEHALEKDMPKARITQILSRHDKKDTKTQLKQCVIELKVKTTNAFVLLSVVTDNLARTKADINTVVNRSRILTATACKHMFTEKGVITTTLLPGSTLDDALEHAIEIGAEDVQLVDEKDSYIQFMTEAQILDQVKTRLAAKGYKIDNYEKVFSPNVTTRLQQTELEAYEKFKTKALSVEGVDDIHDNIEYAEN